MTEQKLFDILRESVLTTLEGDEKLHTFISNVIYHIISSPDLNYIFELEKYPISTDGCFRYYTFPNEIKEKIEEKCGGISNVLVDEIIRIFSQHLHTWVVVNADKLKDLSKEELIEVILYQNRHIPSFKRDVYRPKNELRDLVYRDRSSRPTKPLRSRIDLREDGYKGNDSDEFRHTQIDIMRVIYALYQLDYFVEFNSSIDPKNNGEKDLKRQKRARVSDVFDAFGNAINISNFHDKYNQGFPKQGYSNPKSGQNAVSRKDILKIFDRMKDVMEKYCDDQNIK